MMGMGAYGEQFGGGTISIHRRPAVRPKEIGIQDQFADEKVGRMHSLDLARAVLSTGQEPIMAKISSASVQQCSSWCAGWGAKGKSQEMQCMHAVGGSLLGEVSLAKRNRLKQEQPTSRELQTPRMQQSLKYSSMAASRNRQQTKETAIENRKLKFQAVVRCERRREANSPTTVELGSEPRPVKLLSTQQTAPAVTNAAPTVTYTAPAVSYNAPAITYAAPPPVPYEAARSASGQLLGSKGSRTPQRRRSGDDGVEGRKRHC